MQKMRPFMGNQALEPENSEPFIPEVGKEYSTDSFLPDGKELMKKTYPLSNITFSEDNNVYEVDGFAMRTLVGLDIPSYLVLEDGISTPIPGQIDEGFFNVIRKDNKLYLVFFPKVEIPLLVADENNNPEGGEEDGEHEVQDQEEISGENSETEGNEGPETGGEENSGTEGDETGEEETPEPEPTQKPITIVNGFLSVLFYLQ